MKQEKIDVFLDFEFTWLDYYDVNDNEIISMSYIIWDWKPEYRIYNSIKENTIWSFLINKITRDDQKWKPFFTQEEFLKEMKCETIEECIKKYRFIWYWIYTDFKKCFQEKFNIKFDNISYLDIKEELEINSLYDKKIIENWNSFEVACYLVLNELPNSHTETNEVELQKKLFEHLSKPEIKEHENYMRIHEYVPFWPFKWKQIKDFIHENRKTADWIRHNNIHKFASSLDYLIYLEESEEYDYDD